MSSRRVLAISHHLEQLSRMVSSLERAGAVVDAVRSPDAISTDTIPHRCVFYALDAESGPDQLARVLPRLRARAHLSVVADRAKLQDLTVFLRDDRVNHVIVGDEIDRGVFVTAQKLLTGDIFGIEKYLPEGTPVHYVRLRDFAGRSQAIDTVLEYAAEVGMRRQVRNAIGQVCEELLMNALYDAPVDKEGRSVFAEVEPHERTKTRSPRPVSIRYAATDDKFVIAVRDRFGRLAKNTILAYIEKCLVSPTQIDRKTYGAGLGLYLVASAAGSYVVNVAYGVATEVVCTFDKRERAPLRLVGVFVHPNQAEMLREGPTPETANRAPENVEAAAHRDAPGDHDPAGPTPSASPPPIPDTATRRS